MNFSYMDLLNIRCKKMIVVLFVLLFLIIVFVLSLKFKVHDTYKISGVYKERSIVLTVPLEKTDYVSNADYLYIDGNKYTYKVLSFGEIFVSDIPYQEISIRPNKVLEENEVVEFTFYSNEEKVITKIIDFLV